MLGCAGPSPSSFANSAFAIMPAATEQRGYRGAAHVQCHSTILAVAIGVFHSLAFSGMPAWTSAITIVNSSNHDYSLDSFLGPS